MIGKIDDANILKTIVRPAYTNYSNQDYDLTEVKTVLVYYIRLLYHRQEIYLPVNIEAYKLNKGIGTEFRINIRGIEDLSFHISVKSGKIYVQN